MRERSAGCRRSTPTARRRWRRWTGSRRLRRRPARRSSSSTSRATTASCRASRNQFNNQVKALLSEQPGGPETLRLAELTDPVAGPGGLLVRVRACAINFPDVLIIEDKYQLK